MTNPHEDRIYLKLNSINEKIHYHEQEALNRLKTIPTQTESTIPSNTLQDLRNRVKELRQLHTIQKILQSLLEPQEPEPL